jgi:hypothetical protein
LLGVQLQTGEEKRDEDRRPHQFEYTANVALFDVYETPAEVLAHRNTGIMTLPASPVLTGGTSVARRNCALASTTEWASNRTIHWLRSSGCA